ncbi:MAG: preprotein translocase subunit SecY [Bdellovibrionales bacterium]|nr:preprotein translocase subunit SecY [Bdellovibrionales bacterium]
MSGAAGLVKIPELRKRILFTLACLAVYRIGVHVPTPGVDGAALQALFDSMKGTLFGFLNMFSGGALERFSIFALGVMPYITSSIIFQLLTVVWPFLHELQKEGEQGRRKINQYTRYGTVLICLIQGYSIATFLESATNPQAVVTNPGIAFKLMTILTLTCGSVFLMWLGEQMTERGIGNGTSMLIFAGIAASIPGGMGTTLGLYRTGEMSFLRVLIVLAIILATFFVIVFVERGTRRIPIQYAKRLVGRKVYGGQNTHLPLKINTSGVIPPIFASSLLAFPATVMTFVPLEALQRFQSLLAPGSLIYNVFFVAMIVFFAFFYTAVTFKTDDVAENLKKHGGFVPGIRPGQPTAEYIDFVLGRITLGGAVYISAICVLPTMMTQNLNVPFYFGGTSVLILVGVALDTSAKIEAFLLSRNYEGFMKHTRLKGRSAVS